MEQPQIWHYGLIARDWAEFALDGGKEAQYFKSKIETYGQPALDLGCGTGRLLIPLLQAGLDVDGCDYSQDMLDQCAARAKKEGFPPSFMPRPCTSWICHGVTGRYSPAEQWVWGESRSSRWRPCSDVMTICDQGAFWCSTIRLVGTIRLHS